MILKRTIIIILILIPGFFAAGQDTRNSIDMQLVKINPGTFQMGSETGEFDEKPVHEVRISKPFYMSATPVTNVQYEQFDPGHKKYRGERGFSNGDHEAVIFVTWEEAVAFTKWLSQKESKTYRLPTEAEWEYVCRAGTNTAYSTGDQLPESYFLNQKDEWYPKPVSLEVAQSDANPWGVYNMHGLVEEFCMDWYGDYPPKAQNDPVGYDKGKYRVTRGGSHNAGVAYLRSANRSGMLSDDKNCLVGFRVVQAELSTSKPLKANHQETWAEGVSQKIYGWPQKIDLNKPYFGKVIYFQKVPTGSNGPMYSKHNHCPDITPLPNGDMFATWYTTNEEPGRELAVAAARLKKGEQEWGVPEIFFKVPDRNMHATSIFWDRSGDRIYHFQGVSISTGYANLALFMRVSEDNGVTWTKPHWMNREHGLRNMPIAGVKKTTSNYLVVPCDAVTKMEGGSTIHISNDEGKTWKEAGDKDGIPIFDEGNSGGTIAGIHAGVVELKNGNLMALGRGNNINGYMPKSISADMGKTWTYHTTDFPPIGGGQRLVLMRLAEGPLMLVSFTGHPDKDKGMKFKDADGNEFTGHGLFVALSYDEGETWPTKKLLTPGKGAFDGGAWTKEFSTDATHAEPRGYMAATQAPDGIIHLISSKLHYRFNLVWIKEPNEGK